MIFGAGLGTRFKPWTDKHPKALAPVNGKPLLQRNIEYLVSFGLKNIVVNVHHFADQIVESLQSNNDWGANIIVSDEKDQVLETGGGLIKAKDLFDPQADILTINVDILTSLDLHQFLSFHHQEKPLVSLAVTNRKTSRCFVFDQTLRLTGWKNLQTGEEKIKVHTADPIQRAFSGISIFSPQFFEVVPQKGKFSLVDSFLSLAADYRILGFDHSGDKWVDVGKPETVEIAEKLFQ